MLLRLRDDVPAGSFFAFNPLSNNLRHFFESLRGAAEHGVGRIRSIETPIA